MARITREQMIQTVSEQSEVEDTDVVGFYVDNAAEVILNQLYPYDELWDEATSDTITMTDAVPTRYQNLQMRIAIVFLNKRGADGETMHIENGINRHYSGTDVPPDMLRQIVPKAQVV